ncbi:hypothetical protein ACIBCO_34745 [Streptomyces violascens]|uniref:hypothetical protein n=1 Tax=Streptomyces violascens TaxID=67381 RepID=UPI0037895DFC
MIVHTRKRVTLGRFFAALAGGLLMLAAGLGTAHASPGAEPFAQQARAAHLSTTQTTALKSEVNRYLKLTGGQQVALNKIVMPGRGEVLVALPGEAHPRSLGSGVAAAVDHCLGANAPLYDGWFCAYYSANFQGTEVQWYTCGTYDMNFTTHGGSWSNNQTRGRQARMYGKSGNLIYTTPGAYSSDASANWWSIWKIKPC